MRSIELLREEHRWIALLLDCLEAALREGAEHGRVDARAAAELLALFEHFADGLHQQREEACLFPLLLARARTVDERVGLGRLCGDHEAERRALRLMGARLSGAIYGNAPDLREFLREGAAFVRLHRAHLQDENTGLLPLAEELLGEADDAALVAAFDELDGGGPRRADIGARIQHLAGRVGGRRSASEF